MRDINTEDIIAGRDVVINDHSNQPKLLTQCTNEELVGEEKHRSAVLRKERTRRRSIFVRLFIFAGLIIVFAIGWAHFQGAADLVSMLSGAGGVLMAMANLRMMEKPSMFEARQVAALEEINMILRERGAR